MMCNDSSDLVQSSRGTLAHPPALQRALPVESGVSVDGGSQGVQIAVRLGHALSHVVVMWTAMAGKEEKVTAREREEKAGLFSRVEFPLPWPWVAPRLDLATMMIHSAWRGVLSISATRGHLQRNAWTAGKQVRRMQKTPLPSHCQAQLASCVQTLEIGTRAARRGGITGINRQRPEMSH